jgi:flagellar hook-associated protein 1 FlgK
MSLSGSLFNAVSGLQTAQRQINVTSGNVSNSNVEGYSRKTAPAITAMTAGQNSGVDLGAVRREVNAYLDSEVLRADTQLGALDVKTEFMQRLTQLFGTPENDSTLANGLNDLSAAMEQLAIEPNSASVRNDVVEAADSLVRRLNDFATETKDLRVEADRQIAQGIDAVNGALERIGELNEEISKATALGRPTGELEDERDRQLGTLSQWMDISTFARDNGEIVVMGSTSQGGASTLVDSRAVQFDYENANQLGATAEPDRYPEAVSDPSTTLDSSAGGKLGALFDLRDSTLTDFHRDIDRLAQSVRDRVNAAHNQGTFANEGVDQMTGSTVTTGETADITVSSSDSNPATITFSSVNAAGEVSDTFTIDFTGFAGTTSADLVTYMNTYTDVAGDQLASVGVTASLNAADQLSFTGTGDFTLDTNNTQVSGDFASSSPKSLSHYYGMNNLFETPGRAVDPNDGSWDLTNTAQDLRLRSDIAADPDLLSRGQPSVTVGDQAIADGDNATANALAAAFETGGDIARGGKLPAIQDVKLADYAGDLLSYYATSAQRTETARDFQETMRDELKFRADSESGVNIDEELSNMITFEQAYNASARVISTVQQMFDTLDRMMN